MQDKAAIARLDMEVSNNSSELPSFVALKSTDVALAF